MSVKKMDEVPEKKTESKILAKMGKKEQGRCQKRKCSAEKWAKHR